jgi:two-component SAPR family response regulator
MNILVINKDNQIQKNFEKITKFFMLVSFDYTFDGKSATDLLKKTTYDIIFYNIEKPITDSINFYSFVNDNYPALLNKIIFIIENNPNIKIKKFTKKIKNKIYYKPIYTPMLLEFIENNLADCPK